MKIDDAPAVIAISNQFPVRRRDAERQRVRVVSSSSDAAGDARAPLLGRHLGGLDQYIIQQRAIGNLFHMSDSNAKVQSARRRDRVTLYT